MTMNIDQPNTSLARSLARAAPLVGGADLSSESALADLLGEMAARRTSDLADLDPPAQAALVAARASAVLPSSSALVAAITNARRVGRGLTIKLGVDPTAPALHLGHAAAVVLLGRFQRMGHHPVLVIGDITARIGDPSGRTADRPPLGPAEIARNMATYQQQVAPFLDFSRAQLRHNSEWLAPLALPRFLEALAAVPASTLLQRDDFRSRLAGGHGLSMAELMYPVVMALDSAALHADVEIGGADQLLNMQMGRRIMDAAGQAPQLVVTVPLVEGTDGSGAKMSKSLGNTIPLAAPPAEMFGQLMSIPDRLSLPYLRVWSEWADAEIATVAERRLHPMTLKKLVAAEVVAAVHGVAAALAARRGFEAQFSRRRLDEVEGLPVVELAVHGGASVVEVLTTVLGFVASISAGRRLARQRALRIVGAGEEVVLEEGELRRPLRELLVAGKYLKAGRKVARIR
jgi:tyrosyl-tRNA synthetase